MGMIKIKKIIMILFIITLLSQNLLIYTGSSNNKIFNTDNPTLPSNLNVGDILFCDIKPTIIEKLDDIMPIKLRPYLPPTFSFD